MLLFDEYIVIVSARNPKKDAIAQTEKKAFDTHRISSFAPLRSGYDSEYYVTSDISLLRGPARETAPRKLVARPGVAITCLNSPNLICSPVLRNVHIV